jgi:hypothetical protein
MLQAGNVRYPNKEIYSCGYGSTVAVNMLVEVRYHGVVEEFQIN